MEWFLATMLVLTLAMVVFIFVFSFYMDFINARKPAEKINWGWIYIYIDIDGGHHRINILRNPDNGLIVAKVIPRPGGLCEAWYQGKLIGEFIRDSGSAEDAINRRMNLSKEVVTKR